MAEYFYSLHINDLKKKVIRQSNALFLYVFRVRWLHTDRVVNKRNHFVARFDRCNNFPPIPLICQYTLTLYICYIHRNIHKMLLKHFKSYFIVRNFYLLANARKHHMHQTFHAFLFKKKIPYNNSFSFIEKFCNVRCL